MCKHLVSLVYSKRTGSHVRKAILGYMADRASEDGDGIWTSKGRIARETELSESAVKKAIREMQVGGLIHSVGQRQHRNGWTVEYAIDRGAVEALPDAGTPAPQNPVTTEPRHDVPPTPAPRAPLPRHHVPPNHPYNHPRTTNKANDGVIDLNREAQTFSEFWSKWPNKVAKAAAEKAWKKLSAPDKAQAIRCAPDWFSAWRSRHPDASPIYPATYLNQKRWQDETPSAGNPEADKRMERWRKMGR